MQNKLNDMSSLISSHADIPVVSESKLDSSFPPAQFLITGFHHNFRFNVNGRSEGLFVYFKGAIPARTLTSFTLPIDIQAIPFEIILRKEK